MGESLSVTWITEEALDRFEAAPRLPREAVEETWMGGGEGRWAQGTRRGRCSPREPGQRLASACLYRVPAESDGTRLMAEANTSPGVASGKTQDRSHVGSARASPWGDSLSHRSDVG